jgi:E3 ubiquitin-protein ligase RNF8
MEQLEQQRWDLQNERKNAERELKNMLEQQLCQKELLLRHEYDEQISLLTNERKRIEKSLQEELSSKLSEKDNAYQEELERQKIVLDQSMLERESEKNRLIAELKAKEGLLEQYRSVEENQRQLEDCLEELRKQITEKDDQTQQQKEVTKQVEMDAKQTIVSAMEDEFTCVICQELFISATILPCAHTFCQLCICGWMKKKKNCPVCRRKIKGKAVRSFAFDSAVEKMVETMDDDYKDRRATLRREREEQTRRDQAAAVFCREMVHQPNEDDENDEYEHQETRAGPSRQAHFDRRPRSTLGASISLMIMFFFFDSMQILFAICTAVIATMALAFLVNIKKKLQSR